jgi:hypothetical protein
MGGEMKAAVQNLTIFFAHWAPLLNVLAKNEEETIMMLNIVVIGSSKTIF